MNELELDVSSAVGGIPTHHLFESSQTWRRPVDHNDAPRTVSCFGLLHQMQCQGYGRTPCAQHEQLAARPAEIILAEDGVHAQPAGNRVGRATDQLTFVLGNAGDLLGCPCVGSEAVKQVGGSCQQIDFVCCDERAEGQRLPLDIGYDLPVAIGSGVNLHIDPNQRHFRSAQCLHPKGEDPAR